MKLILSIILLIQINVVYGQNPLVIPPSLTGTIFNLNIQTGTKVFFGNTPTPTFGINGDFLSPTIIVNEGDSITLNVTNNLKVSSTMHWHGLHVSAMNDGGPHQIINPTTTWSPSFKVRNNASTHWYHPHGINQTEQQVSKGLVGFFIVKDSAEAALALPRTYGVDDIPLIIQNKAFDVLQQIAIASDMDTAIFINGTLNPYFNAPAQVLRFRLVNGSSLRTYNVGFNNEQTFYQIGTDGGLLDSSLALTRLMLSPGERAEILVNFSGLQFETIYLKSFAAELENGIYGSDSVGDLNNQIPDYYENYLNGSDYNLMQINVVAQTVAPITTIPSSLVTFTPYSESNATNFRTIVMDTIRLLPIDPPNRAEGPFGMNSQTFSMDVINEVVHLNTTEIWTLVNKTLLAHPFHIHDIEFNIIEKGGLPPSPSETGWKDVVLVMPNDSVKFITKFTTFADNTTPYMYHCHLLHHEDDGMMGSFLVIDSTSSTGITDVNFESDFSIFPNPTTGILNINSKGSDKFSAVIFNSLGKKIEEIQSVQHLQLNINNYSTGIYFIQIQSNKNLITRKIIKQ